MPGTSGSSDPLIVCAATQYWDEAWFRKQHFMAHLAARRPVLYVEPSFSLARHVPPACPPGQANPPFTPRVRPDGERLWILTPPRGLPFWTHPLVSRLHYARMGRLLRRAATALGYSRVWLWLYNPLYIQATGTLRPERVIFDLVDELGAYDARRHSRATMRQCVTSALATADLALTTSPLLAHAYAPQTRTGQMHVVPNGVRDEWIHRPPGATPEILRSLPRPWMGYVGAIFSYLDFELLRATARAVPDGSLILVGPVRDAGAAERLRREPNVHLLGPRPQAEVPDFIGAFDVCLCPFRVGDVRRAVNPLKVYEYLAAGRPVVATPLESLAQEPVARVIRFAEGTDAFVAAVRAALAEDARDPRGAAARREAVRPYAWETLSERVAMILEAAERNWTADSGHAESAGAR
jgi:glycosyltransferase involved in cell wall biosynthesis